MAHFRLIILFLIIISFKNTPLSGQTTVFEKEVTDNLFNKEKGPNLKKFNHFYMNFGGMAMDNDGARVLYHASTAFSAGYRHKRKLLRFYSLGFDISIQHYKYRLKQENEKTFPDPILHDREKIMVTNSTLELYHRVTLGKTGNAMGFFIDTGVYGSWNFGRRHWFRNTFENTDATYEMQIVENRRLKYINPFVYGAKTRIGYNKFAVYGSYQLSDITDDGYPLPGLPPLSVGVELSFY
ncbi:MAG: hypothetical protein ACOC10_02910 [Bacteroidota bacterium]